MKVIKKFPKYFCTIDFDRVRTLVKFRTMFLVSSCHCIGDNKGDVGECKHINLSSWQA